MSKKPHILGIAAVAALVVLSAFVFRPKPDSPATRTSDQRPTTSDAGERQKAKGESLTPNTENQKPKTKNQSSTPDTLSENSLTLLGTVQAATQAALSVRLPARIQAVPVKRGDRVQTGQLLVQLDDADFLSQVRTAEAGVQAALAQVRKAITGKDAQRIKADSDIQQAEGGLRQAKVKLSQATLARNAAQEDLQSERRVVQEGVRKAEAGLEQAQRILRSLEELDKVGGVSKSELEGARTQVKIAQSDLATAQAQARRLEAGPEPANGPTFRVALAQKDVDATQAGLTQSEDGVRTAKEARRRVLAVAEEDVRAAEAALAQAKAGVEGAKAALASMRIASPISGVVSNLEARVGETAQPGIALVTVVSLLGVRVEALASARHLSRIHVGQAARITVDTQPGHVFSAVVSEISRIAEPDGRSFRVRFRFVREASSLRPGQTARITMAAP
jgi:multidrug resistance efflux pump